MADMDETHDFVVVGSGGGSMCAGLVLRKAGKSVLILEKTEYIGGSTAKAGGVMWIPDNRFMRAKGEGDSFDKAQTYLDSVVDDRDAPGSTRERRATYLREAPQMLDFLIDQGIEFEPSRLWPDYYDDAPGGVATTRTVVAKLFDMNQLGEWKHKLRPNQYEMPLPIYDAVTLPLVKVSWRARLLAAKMVLRGLTGKLTGKYWTSAGRALQGRMLQAAVRAGIELRTHTPVAEVIVENGRAVGVVTEKDGKPWRIGARMGVLLNAGGFAHNQEMRDRYMPNTRSEWSYAAPGDTGDMHRELMRLGAAMGQMNEMVGNQVTMLPGNPDPAGMQPQLAKPHAFLVDQTGQRYMNEAGSYMEFCQNVLKRHETVPAIPSWMIIDSQYMRKHMLGPTMPGSKKPDEWYSSGFLVKADTLEELAGKIGASPENLRATTDRFNGFARKGVDEDFRRGAREYDRWLGDFTHKPNGALGTVEEGPFYALRIYPGDVGTFGGVVTDCSARVLREDGSVIEGLYATGTTTAAVMGRTYPGAGCSIGPSFTWGFVAAKHAAGLGNVGV